MRAERVSVSSTGEETNRQSFGPLISRDGRFIAFTSFASNLDALETGDSADVFIRDTEQGSTLRVTHSQYHSYLIDMSSDGRYILYGSQIVADRGWLSLFVHDRVAATDDRVDVSNAQEPADGSASSYGAISDDGRYVAFGSSATNLATDDANGVGGDLFVRDRVERTTTRVSANEADGFCPQSRVSMSSDGLLIAFSCYRPYSQPLFVLNQETSLVETIDDQGADPSMSDDGRYVAFMSGVAVSSSDANGYDVFVRDRQTGTTEPVSVVDTGGAGNLTSQGPSISGDGRYVAFYSGASDFVAHDTNGTSDVFVRDLSTNQLIRASVKNGLEANGSSQLPSLSESGRYVAYMSDADNLVRSDDNRTSDVFKADLLGSG